MKLDLSYSPPTCTLTVVGPLQFINLPPEQRSYTPALLLVQVMIMEERVPLVNILSSIDVHNRILQTCTMGLRKMLGQLQA